MAEKKFILPGPETVTMSGFAVDKLIQAGDGDAALLYLYILKNRGGASTSEASEKLGRSTSDIELSMTLLARLGLVRCDDIAPTVSQDEETPEYTASDIKRELKNGSAFYTLVQEVQRSVGKMLSSDDLIKLFGIYDNLHLPVEVILQLVTHCIEESRRRYGPGRVPTMRYIEKAAYTWEREGIFSLDKAEEYIKRLETSRSVTSEIQKVIQIRDRLLSASERKYIESWIEMGFDPETIEIAYDKTILKTGRLTWGYIDSILKNWYGSGLHTSAEILQGDKKKIRSLPGKESAPDFDDYERMKKLLKKMKEG